MNKRLILATALVCVSGTVARGQFAPSNAPPVFTVLPASTMGTVVGNSLVLTALPNGFVVTGQVQIAIAPGPASGILVQWTVERRLDPAFTASGIQNTTILTGFSAPPVGTFGTTSGTVLTDWRFATGGTSVVGGSQATVPMTLVNGIDSPPWTGLTATSVPFTWTAGFFPTGVMQQRFTLFGNYTGGPGGIWVIDVPVTSIATIPCPPDLTNGAVPGSPGFGVPNGVVNNDDYFYYLGQFAAGNLAVADLTTGAVPGAPGYGVPNGVLNNDDYFFYLSLFVAGC